MLPSQVFGTFAFDSNDDEDTKLINIEADNDEWFLYSTTGVRVLDNGNYTYRLKLEMLFIKKSTNFIFSPFHLPTRLNS